MTEYVMRYQPTPELLGRAMIAWAKPQRSWGDKIKRAAFGVILYLVLVACVAALLRYDLVTNAILASGVVGFVFGITLWSLFYRKNMKKITRYANDAMARHGVTEARFAAKEIQLTSQISETRMDWLCFDEVIALDDATVLRSGGVVYALPDEGLPEGATPQQFRSDLQSWMEAAR